MTPITDRASLTDWLEGQPHDVQIAVAARGALRTLTGLGSTSADRFGEIAIVCLRTAMTAAVATRYPSNQLREAAAKLGGVTSRIAVNATLSEFVSALSVSSAALTILPTGTEVPTMTDRPSRWMVSTGPTPDNATQAVSVITNDASPDIRNLIFSSVWRDAHSIASGTEVSQLMSMPLWEAPPVPEEFANQYKNLNWNFAQSPATWSFWSDWYNAILSGEGLDWELQRRVVLIPDFNWGKGPAHVASLIDEIRARLEVERNAEAVMALLASPDLVPAGIGHNNPPDAIDDLPVSPDDLVDVERMIARVIQEVAAEEPDKDIVLGAGAWIRSALWKATVWFAKKADVAAEEFAKKFGGYCAAAALPTAAWALGQMPRLLDALSELARSLETWLPFIK